MTAVLVVAWPTALVVASFYVLYEHNPSRWAKAFTWANALGALVLVPANVMLGATFGAFLGLVFGLGAAHGLWRANKQSKVFPT